MSLPSSPSTAGSLRLVPLSIDALHALLRDDLETASAIAGVPSTPCFVEHRWLWNIRVPQIDRDPAAADWIARAAVDRDVVIGHVGFHGSRMNAGWLKSPTPSIPSIGGVAMPRRCWALRSPGRTKIRMWLLCGATVGPGNVASLATLAAFPFELVGEQWDEDDGLEQIFEMRFAVQSPPSSGSF